MEAFSGKRLRCACISHSTKAQKGRSKFTGSRAEATETSESPACLVEAAPMQMHQKSHTVHCLGRGEAVLQELKKFQQCVLPELSMHSKI